MQEFSLNEEFFQENFSLCSKKVHPIIFLQDYFQEEATQFNKPFPQETLQNLIQSHLKSPLDDDLLEELLNRVRFEKKKSLTFNEFFKVFQEAETVLLLKVEYMRFLYERNTEIQSKIEGFLNKFMALSISNTLDKEKKLNILKIEFFQVDQAKDKEIPCFIFIKYGDYEHETPLSDVKGIFPADTPLEMIIRNLEDMIEFQAYKPDNEGKPIVFLGKTRLSLYYLDFFSKNKVKVNIMTPNGGFDLIMAIEIEISEKKQIISQFEAKIRDIDKENTRLSQEKHAYKSQLALLLKPFNKTFDPDEFYKFDQILVEVPKSLKIFDGISTDPVKFSKKILQDLAIKQKELRISDEVEVRTIDMGGHRGKIDEPEVEGQNTEEQDKVLPLVSLDGFT